MLDNNQHSLLALVRLALCGKADIDRCSFDWQYLYNVAHKQGVLAMLQDSIRLLPPERCPGEILFVQWIGYTAVIERRYAQHRQAVAQLAAAYAQHGIPMMLMKGYACSLDYPVPQHRPAGDIDIYLFGHQQEADEMMEREHGIAVHREYHKHSTFHFLGVEVENHAKFIDDVSHKSNIRFEETLMRALKDYPCIESPIDNVLLPSPTFNAIFLLRHAGEHFASNEISLRHILDIGTFFRRYYSDIDWNFVSQVYESERMRAFFNGIATICVEYLGIASECFGSGDNRYIYEKNLSLAERILADVFEKKENLAMSTTGINTDWQKINYSIGKTRRWWHNRWKYKLVYNESLVESFLWLAKNRLKSF